MTDPTAYGEGMGGALLIFVVFLGSIALARVVAYVRHQIRVRRHRKTTVGRLAGMSKLGGTK